MFSVRVYYKFLNFVINFLKNCLVKKPKNIHMLILFVNELILQIYDKQEMNIIDCKFY